MGFALGAVISRMGFIAAVGASRREMFAIEVGESFRLVWCRQKVLHPLRFEAELRQIDHLPFGVVSATVASLRKVHRQALEIYQFADWTTRVIKLGSTEVKELRREYSASVKQVGPSKESAKAQSSIVTMQINS